MAQWDLFLEWKDSSHNLSYSRVKEEKPYDLSSLNIWL